MPVTRIGMKAVVAIAASLSLVLAVVVSPPQSATAATYTLSVVPLNSGTSTADAAGVCPTQVIGGTAHCPGYDISLSAADKILRTGDTASVRFDFASSGADTGVILTSTLPLDGTAVSSTWTAIPAACASGSALSDGNRTLTCRIVNPAGAVNASVTAILRMAPSANDGYTFTVPATIQSATSPVVNAASTATYTTSSAPFWNISKTVAMNFNTLPAPFFYRSNTGVPGYAIPTSTIVNAGRIGGFSPMAGPVTWTETMTSSLIDVSGYRLLNWGNYGDGCASDGQAATPANAGYSNAGFSISNQTTAPVGNFNCAQPGGPGTPINVAWSNPNSSNPAANMWMLLWVPSTVVPASATTAAPIMTASGFDPVDTKGVSNYIAATEPTGDNARSHLSIVTGDNRSITKRPVADLANPYSTSYGAAIGTITRGGSFISQVTFQNTGTVAQDPVQICDVIDVTTQKLSPFATSALVPANTYAVATTIGPLTDPITAPPYQPAATFNNTNNFTVSPSAYTIEYAAGELGGTTPTTAPAAASSFTGLTCGDASTATGWHSSPTDPAFVAYAGTLGLTDPLDVVNRIRVTFTGGAVTQQQLVALKAHVTTRSTYRAATSQAGQTIFATTRIADAATADYPQISIAHWTPTIYAGPTVAGLINVNTNVDITSATPTNVQAGAIGQNQSTYTVRASIAFGENVSTTQPLRVVYSLPVGMRYVANSASLEPDHVLPQANGSTILVWDLGNITGTTNGTVTTAPWTFKGEADPLAPTPSINYSTAISESRSPTGAQLDPDVPGCGTQATITIPPTPTVPVTTTTPVPLPADYSGCLTQGNNRRMDYQPVQIGSAFLNLAAYKSAFAPLVESGADDGVGGSLVGWNLTYRNTTSNPFPGVDIIDVLPYLGDGRTPASNFSGTVALKSLTTTDAMSSALTPNLLPASAAVPGSRTGTTFYVTSAAPASINWDPYDATNLLGGSTPWCVLGAATCTVTLAQATAVRVISGEMVTGAERTVRLGFATDGALQDQRMTNTAKARVVSLTTAVDISGDSISFASSSIAGTVWADTNADGVVDATETARLANVTVTLTGTASSGEAVTRTATTAADGTYLFAGLGSGSYTVTVNQPSVRAIDAGYAITADPDGVAAPDGAYTVALTIGTDVTARNFGFTTSSLAGTVFGDDNNNGAIDSGETGTAGVTVTLTGTDDLGQSVSRTTTTVSGGGYTFASVRPGDYELVVTVPSGLFNGRNIPGTAGGSPSFNTSTIEGITLDAGQNGVGYLFGLLVPEIVRGVVYEDSDDDGVQDAGEPGIAGVTVTLTGTATVTTQTVADGQFVFANLGPGTYQITETQPSGYLNGVNATNGSVGTVGTVGTDSITDIVVGTIDSTDSYSFGDVPQAAVSGVVYDDLNANGVRDVGEPGIAGAQVSLSGHSTAGPLTTGADGAYVFDGLEPGTYTLTSTEASGYLDAFETAGTAGGNVSTVSGSATITNIVLGVGVRSTGYLFGDVRAASLAGVVFDDTDSDGVRDAGEAGLGGVFVALNGTDMFGAAVHVDGTTELDGTYSFPDLLPGTYRINEAQPGAYLDGSETVGTAGGTIDTAPDGDEISDIELGSGVAATGYLFAEIQPLQISGFVFEDLNGNGVMEAGEAGILGVDIELAGPAGTYTATTAVSGAWTIVGILPGTYTLTEQAPQPITGYIDGPSVAGTAGGTVAPNAISDIVLDSDADGYLFGEIPMSVIRGTVWHDQNDNGVIDSGEPLLAGVEVTLSGTENHVTVTNADGTFVFGDLQPGTYALTEETLSSWADGTTLVGPAGGTAGVNTVTGISLGAGVDGAGYGFGERVASLQLAVLAQTQDAQLPTGPYVAVGDTVRLGYSVTNNGDTAVENISVVDDILGPVVCPDTTLAAGDSMFCSLDSPSVAGQQMHTGTVTADVVTSAPVAGAQVSATASDLAHYFGMVATATLTTTVNGQAAGQAPGPVFRTGQSLRIVATITNTGNVPLELASLGGEGLESFDCGGVVTLAPGDVLDCTLDVVPPVGNFAFEVEATFTAPDGTAVDGATEAGEAGQVGGLAFQVLEPGVTLPTQIAQAGVDVNWGGPMAVAAFALLGGVLLMVARREKRREEFAD